ncbi:hypothetical protein GINT2_001965 [Glugoides intestinalis]
MSVRLKLERFELSDEFDQLKDQQCINAFMRTSNDRMLRCFRRKKHYGEITEDSNWYDFKSMLLDRFGVQDAIKFRSLARWRKNPNEGIRDFVEKIDDIGLELGIGKKYSHNMIKEQLRKSGIKQDIVEYIVNYKLNRDSSVNLLNKFEAWVKGKEGKNDKDIKQNNVENPKIVSCFKNKTIRVNEVQFSVIFDTGAFYNFLSEETASKMRANIEVCAPKSFSTRLGERFTIQNKARIIFNFEDQTFEETFYILPNRKGECTLIGMDFKI